MEIKKPTKRGTDHPFLQLMSVSGSSILKLLGIAPEKADKYQYRAVVLKDTHLEPDVEGLPIFESDEGRIFLEFQGYSDTLIRTRLAAKIFLGCLQAPCERPVMAGIVYTDKAYKTAALPLPTFVDIDNCRLSGCLREIVLSDYTEQELLSIDPKLVVLAPFTQVSTDKPTLLAKGREWTAEVRQVFPTDKQPDVLNLLGLFILDRFRNLSEEEVRTMLHIDLMDSLAGQQLYERGQQDGLIKDARTMILTFLEEKFGIVPGKLIDQIHALNRHDVLENLFRQAMRCPDLDSFKQLLSKAKE
jgi:hypothetical protein